MASLADFMEHVLPYVAGCSYPLAELHIRNVCVDFCTHAPVVQVRLDPIDVEEGRTEYDLDTPSGTVTTLILQAAYNERPLAIYKTGDIADSLTERPGEPLAIKQAAENLFTLDSVPQVDAPQAIRVLVATKPTRTASSVADVLLNDYAHDIAQGVVGRLMLIPGHEFSNPAIAPLYEMKYRAARTAARIRAEASFGATGDRVRPRRFI